MTLRKVDDLIAEKKQNSAKFAAAYEQAGVDLEIAIAVKQLRDSLDLSQRAFAELVGKPQSTIARIESGAVTASNQTLSEIAQRTHKQLRIQFI